MPAIDSRCRLGKAPRPVVFGCSLNCILSAILAVPRPTCHHLRQDDCSGSLHLKFHELSTCPAFPGDAAMEFVDRLLTCADCGGEFIFTAGEQLFFFDKQFKNDPKRCKPCKSRRAGISARPGAGPAAAGISRTETRTVCSDCGIETTVPFKPTQGRPVLCRQCFQNKRDAPACGRRLRSKAFL